MKFLGFCFCGEVMEYLSELGTHMKWIFIIVIVNGKINSYFMLSNT
jgi:hypothetical protein